MSDMPPHVRDARPRTLASWRLRDSRNMDTVTEPNNIGFDFAGKDIPKYKFLFTVSFDFGDAMLAALNRRSRITSENMDSNDMSKNVFACRNVTRPNITISYADINSYNYRYKVATRTDYGTVTLTMYDDNKNRAHNVVTEYLKLVSPIANKPPNAVSEGLNIQEWASLGPLPTDEPNGLIRAMRVTHHVNSDNIADDDAARYVVYDYVNPRMQSIAYDELDMSVSDVSSIALTFVYDSVNIFSDIGRPKETLYGTTGDVINARGSM